MPCDLKEEKEFLLELYWFLRVQNFVVEAVCAVLVKINYQNEGTNPFEWFGYLLDNLLERLENQLLKESW